MRYFIAGIMIGLIVSACAMGSKKAERLTSPMDDSETPWVSCTAEMVEDYKGKVCIVECAEKLKKDGSCKNNKYKYRWKDYKDNHEFFKDHILIHEKYVY